MEKNDEILFRPISSHVSIPPLTTTGDGNYSYSFHRSASNPPPYSDLDALNHPFAPSHRYKIDRVHSDSEFSSPEDSNTQKSEDEGKTKRKPLTPVREICFLMAVCTAQFLALGGTLQTITALPVISEWYGVEDPGAQSWMTAGYSLSFSILILVSGQLGDIYGPRTLFLIGFVWFGVASLAAGFACYGSFILFATMRGFQGIGPSITVPNALALIGRIYSDDPNRKNLAMALFAAAAPTGATMGGLISALYAQLLFWPGAFWTTGGICLIMAVLGYLAIPPDNQTKPTANDGSDEKKDIKFDWLGCATGVTGLVLFNFAWNQAPVSAWSVPYVQATLVLGVAFLVAFILIERYVATNPLVPVGYLTWTGWLALAVIGVGWSSFGIWTYYLWITIEQLRGYSLLSAVAQNSPVALAGVIASVLSGWLLNRIDVSFILLGSLSFFTIGNILVSVMPLDDIYFRYTFLSMIIMPFGMDSSFPAGTSLVSAGLPSSMQGAAASLVNTVVNYSISQGLGLAGTILKQQPPAGEELIDEFIAYRHAWYAAVGLAVMGWFLALALVMARRSIWMKKRHS